MKGSIKFMSKNGREQPDFHLLLRDDSEKAVKKRLDLAAKFLKHKLGYSEDRVKNALQSIAKK